MSIIFFVELLMFIVLKLLKVINWSWLWVLAPIWIPIIITIMIVIITFIIAKIASH